ncbi:MAG: ABC transporter permease subunit [Acidimicrobiales bacterium]
MNWTAIFGIVRRDLTAARRSPAVVVPMVVVPLVVVTVLPAIAYMIRRADTSALPLGALIGIMPADLYDAASTDPARLALLLVTFVFPTILLVVPLMVVSVISTDSVAGERERGTLEGVLVSPIGDRELLLAKILSAALPAFVIHLSCSLLYCLAANLALGSVVDGLVLPTLPWLIIVVWVGPAFTALMLGASVLISARAKSVQGAAQLSGVAVLPLIVMVVGQIGGVALLSGLVALNVGAGLWGATALLVRSGRESMSRHRLAARLP